MQSDKPPLGSRAVLRRARGGWTSGMAADAGLAQVDADTSTLSDGRASDVEQRCYDTHIMEDSGQAFTRVHALVSHSTVLASV